MLICSYIAFSRIRVLKIFVFVIITVMPTIFQYLIKKRKTFFDRLSSLLSCFFTMPR